MNNKAFTLVELLGVIIILMIIALLVFPAVSDIINKSTDTVYQSQINSILKSAYDFSLKNTSYLPSTGEKSYVTLGELKSVGLIDFNIKDPNTRENFDDDLVISISNVGTKYSYDKKISKLKGNYLYKIEFKNSDDEDLLPTITLNGLTKNSNNNYIVTLSLNEEMDNITYSAESSEGVDLTDKVKTYISNNDIVVDEIDSSKSNIYKIYYVVVDEDGYSSMTILNVIIADTTKPTITLPSNNTISTNVSNIDLLDGVKCTDNSGFCEITASGTINYGTKGKYIIEYTATDPSGNTTVSKRVITVE